MKSWKMMSIACLMVLGVAVVGVADSLDYREEFERTLTLPSGGSVALDNVNGDVSITAWDSDEVQIRATKAASSRELLDRLEIDVTQTGSSIRIQTRYPHHNGDHHWKRHGRSTVEYTLSVPRWADLDGIDLVNGSLSVDGVEGDIEVESVNGSVELRDVAGSIDADTVNGSLEVWAPTIRSGAEVSLESVNGTIDLHMPAGVSARIDAETVNGRISNDFGLEVKKGKWVGSDMRGSIGGGDIEVSMETVNGAIRLHSN